jgi:hypothetical protein
MRQISWDETLERIGLEERGSWENEPEMSIVTSISVYHTEGTIICWLNDSAFANTYEVFFSLNFSCDVVTTQRLWLIRPEQMKWKHSKEHVWLRKEAIDFSAPAFYLYAAGFLTETIVKQSEHWLLVSVLFTHLLLLFSCYYCEFGFGFIPTVLFPHLHPFFTHFSYTFLCSVRNFVLRSIKIVFASSPFLTEERMKESWGVANWLVLWWWPWMWMWMWMWM